MILTHENLSVIWIVLPLFVGFSIYLLPKIDRALALVISLSSLIYGLWHVFNPAPLSLNLLDNFGVSLLIDGLSGFFILTNAIVTAAVIIYCWQSGKEAFFYAQAIILHGSVNAVFVSADLISVYVALEVISIAAFLLIAYPRTGRSIWIGLRYLFVSNTAMLFYLIGAVLVYQANNSFAFTGMANAPTEAIALIFLGLLTKGGIFVSGLWLPQTHSDAETPGSALLSGVVIKAGVFPLVRFALMMPELDPLVRFFGVATALLGVSYAVFAKDSKRMLAFHTVSQLGFILAAPIVGGFYALTHGLVKSALFLIAGNLPSRNIKELKKNPIPTSMWVALAIASFSISGFPMLAGFGAKVLTSKNLAPWQVIGMNIAALGTAISFAKFIFLPHTSELSADKVKKGFWVAMVILLGGLVLANGFYYDAYSLKNTVKPLVTIAAGWLAYLLLFQKLSIKLPRVPEQFDHLIGAMSLVLTFLFWMVVALGQPI
ncbi:MAG: cation:proton antiporter [Cyanobacteria bacterium P01_F01_bin.150]